MKNASIRSPNRGDGMSSLWTTGSRVALLFTVVLLLMMPWTEYFWSFDKFLRGGQDFELGLLSIATIFCLLLVMLQHRKCSLRESLSFRKWLSIVFRRDDPFARGSFTGLIAVLHFLAVPSPPVGQCTLPLQI